MLGSAVLFIPDGIISKYKKVIGLLLAGLIAIPTQGGAQSSPGNITIEKGGEIWIEGTAGPVDFTCRAEKLSGQGKIENADHPRSLVKEQDTLHISVKLPVKSLNCGKQAMNEDMYKALRAESFPFIHYHLITASTDEESSNTSAENWMNIHTRGIMEIAGVKDTTAVKVRGKMLGNNRFQVRGSKNIHMDTYKIDPPSKMFGLIRAHKELTVHFDVTVNLKQQEY